jgi:hypothetical protein
MGPLINITTFKVGPTIIPPAENDPSIDITDSVYKGSQLQYAVVDNNTVEYIVTLDESVGNFSVGRIGLFMDNGNGTSTLFSITSMDSPNPDYKFKTSGNVVGDRLTYSIYLAISNMSKITNFTIPLLPLLSVPEASSEQDLPDPLHVAFNSSQVMKHSVMRVPSIAYRETLTQGRLIPAWLMSPERLIPGQGEGIVPVVSTAFDTSAIVGTVVGLDYTNQKIIVGEPTANKWILGVRSADEEITNYGMYVDPVNTYSPMQRLFVDTGANAGKLTTIPNQWPVGYALGSVSTQNAVGCLCWIDFTLGFGGSTTAGPPGPVGPPGIPGPGGTGGGGYSNPGQCYLKKVGSNLILIPYNGNSILINSVKQRIPAEGVALPPTGLNPSTLYYIYAFMKDAVMSLQASTINHITSTFDGVEIMNTDQSKTLVGMAYTVAGPAWSDTDGQLYVLSWFNRRRKRTRTIVPTLVRTGGSQWVSVGGHNYFLVWSNNLVFFSISGSHGSTGGNSSSTSINFDGVLAGQGLLNESEGSTVGQSGPESGRGYSGGAIATKGCKKGLIEAAHWANIIGVFASGGNGVAQWRNYVTTVSGAPPSPVSLTISVDG